MSDPTPESVIAEALRQSRFADWDTTARRILDALAAQRMTVVTLPEVAGPDEMGSYRVPVDADGYIRVEPEDQWGDPVISPLMVGLPLRDLAKARRYAAALLAATDVVEESR